MKVLVVVAVLAAGVLGYFVGYKTGPERQGQLDDAKFRISFGNQLYRRLEAGETNGTLSVVRALLWSDTITYQRRYGVPSARDSFARHFAEAKLITANVESEVRQNGVRFEQEVRSILRSNTVSPKK